MKDAINVQIITSDDVAKAFTIRQKVFVEEQKVPEERKKHRLENQKKRPVTIRCHMHFPKLICLSLP